MSEAVIEVAGLTKHFGEIVAVAGLDFTVEEGSVTALLGGNGAGKTTTLSMLLGLLVPSAGRVTVMGQEMPRHRHRVLPRMNFTSPYVELPHRLTVAENLRVYGHLYGLDDVAGRVERLAASFAIEEFMGRPFGKLSAGQKTRVSLAKALINDPALVLLDEPTASLDPDTADWVRERLLEYRRRTGATLLLASHNMAEVERLCTDVLMMRAGQLVDRGSPQALLQRYGRDTMEEVFLDVARRRGRGGVGEAAQ